MHSTHSYPILKILKIIIFLPQKGKSDQLLNRMLRDVREIKY